MSDNRNTILAVILSGLVLIAWQYFYNVPQMEKRRLAEQAQSELVKPSRPGDTSAAPQAGASPAPRANCAVHAVWGAARHCGSPGRARCSDRSLAAGQDRNPERDRQHFAE